MPGWEMWLILIQTIFKMKKFILLLLIIGVASCKSTKQPTAAKVDLFVIENLSGMTSEEIKTNYTDANITEDIGVFDEGTEERPYTTLYTGTPDEIQITWEDAGRTRIHDIRFSNSGKWRSNTGIKIGTNYKELNQINGKEISFYGFGWDYSGAVVWNGGKLENSNLFVFLESNNIPGNFYGDNIIEATPEEIDQMNLKVSTILYKL